MSTPGDMAPVRHEDLYHTGIVVEDLDAAIAEFTDLFGLRWGPHLEFELPVLSIVCNRCANIAGSVFACAGKNQRSTDSLEYRGIVGSVSSNYRRDRRQSKSSDKANCNSFETRTCSRKNV